MGLQIGEKYEVACAELRWREDGRIYHVPVFDHFHADPQFGFPDQHYHIDGRFEIEPRMRHHFALVDGQTSFVIIKDSPVFEFMGIHQRSVRCVRNETGLRVSGSELYNNWYETFIGKNCAGKRCPHFGTEMLERNGQLVCPMHGLTADLLTLQVVAIPMVIAGDS